MPESIEPKLFATFASAATSLGYSDVHGRIIAALMTSKDPVSLQDIAKKTGYSLAAISLSLDLLEIVGVIRKMKNPNDRKLYARIEGDVLQALRTAFLFKIQKEIAATLAEFQRYKGDRKNREIIEILEKEIRRLEAYVDKLAKVELPK